MHAYKRYFVLAVLAVFSYSLFIVHADANEDKKNVADKDIVLKQLLDKKDIDNVFDAIDLYKSLSLTRKIDFLTELRDSIDDGSPSKLVELGDTHIYSEIKSGKTKFDGHGMIIHHNIRKKSGLSALIASEVTGVSMPPVGLKEDPKESASRAKELLSAYIKGLKDAFDDRKQGDNQSE